MKCPYCGHQEDRVLDSRPLEAASIIRRRSECQACHKRFTTYERLEEVPLMVLKSNERREPFNREKLREGILRACEKRPIGPDVIERIIAEIEYELQDYVMQVPSRVIGEKALKNFKVLDPVHQTSGIIDPKNFDTSAFQDFQGPVCVIPPHGMVIAQSYEYFRIPREVLVICNGKSTYSRCGIVVSISPLEPEWE